MADSKHWEVANDREMWLKAVGHEQEDRTETFQQAGKIFDGISEGEDCLEIGCGPARFARFALYKFLRYVGIDSSREMLGGLESRGRVHTVYTDGTHIPFTDGFFDFVYSFTCFQHMPTLEMVRENLSEAHRVLKPGGLFRVQTVQGDYLESGRYDGVVFKTIHDFAEEFKAVGFKIEDAHLDGEWIWVTAKK